MAHLNLRAKTRKPFELNISTGDNPLKKAVKEEQAKKSTSKVPGNVGSLRRQLVSKFSNILDDDDDDKKKEPFSERMARCRKYMSRSSLYLVHKKTSCRKRLIVMTLGDSTKPLFKTVDQLLEFYTK